MNKSSLLSSQTRKVHRTLTRILMCAAFATWCAFAPAADSKALIKDANTAIRAGEKSAFAGKAEEAKEQLDKATELIGQVKSADPDNPQIRTLERKCQSLQKVIARKLPKAPEPPVPEAPNAAPPSASSSAASQVKVPAAVAHRLKAAASNLDRAKQVLGENSSKLSADYRIKTAEAAIQAARGAVDEALKGYSDKVSSDTPEVKAVADEIAAVERQLKDFTQEQFVNKAKESAQAAAAEEASTEWITKLKPYVFQPGLDTDQPKALIPSATRQKAEMEKRMTNFAEASAVFGEYQKAKFPSGKSEELQKLEEDLGRALRDFAESWESYIATDVAELEKRLADADAFIAREEAKKGGAQKPLLLQKDILADINRKIESLAAMSKKDDQKVAGLRDKLDAVKEKDAKMRADRVADTRMLADKYSGADAGEIRTKAGEFVNKAFADAKILRTTIISSDWKEESVIEPTDSTNTALRYRTTRSVTAQVAAKRGGDCFLYTVDVSKNKNTDGTWGELYGHVMFTDPILEENVEK